VGIEQFMRRDLAARVMIEVFDARAEREHALERRRVGLHRNIQHGELVTCVGIDAREQCDVALYTGDELRRARMLETKLMERADAVRVAVENVVRFRHATG